MQVCGPPGFMNVVSGDKAPDKSQGEVILSSFQVSSEGRVPDTHLFHTYLIRLAQMAIL